MKHFTVHIEEKGKDTLLTPSYCGDVDDEFLIKFFGLDEPDVEYFLIEEDTEKFNNNKH